MVWGQGDGSGLRCVDSAVGRIGQLACWEHYNPLARYALMADGEQIHSAMYPGSFAGDGFSEQISVNIRQHALEAGCFVVCATAWLDAEQQARIMRFPKGHLPPAEGFWSLTMYDSGYFFVNNPLNRYSISARENLKENPDGSTDLYIQKDSPGKDKESNWLPAPEGDFILMLRMML